MHLKAPVYGVFLLATLVLCTVYIDDQEGSPRLLWDGSWERYSDLGSGYTELAWQGTLSLGNQSGATVTFTFTGTSVGVFGSLWPGETESARSTYVVDNGRPTEFVPQVLQEPSRLQFYSSGTLPEGEHTLKVTNLGAFLWLDYFEFDDVVVSSSTSRSASTLPATTARPSSTTITARPSPATIATASPSPSSTKENDRGPISSTTSESATSSHPSVGISNSTSSTVSQSSSAAAAPPPLYSLPSSPSSASPSYAASGASSSPNVPPPPQDAATPQTHADRISHGALVGLIAAMTAGGVALLALILVYLGCRRSRRTRSQLREAPLSSFQKPAPSDSEEGDPHASGSGDASLCSTTPSNPPAPVVRPAAVCACQAELGDVPVRSCHPCGRHTQPPAEGPRATDGGVSVAGGRGFSNGDAPSIAGVEDEKNMLPPSYQDSTGP